MVAQILFSMTAVEVHEVSGEREKEPLKLYYLLSLFLLPRCSREPSRIREVTPPYIENEGGR